MSDRPVFKRPSGMRIAISDILSAFEPMTIGSKVTRHLDFISAVEPAIAGHDFSSDRVPGQGVIDVPAAIPFVSAGVGKKTSNPADYVLREHRGNVGAYLRREHAAITESCNIVVYTREAYLRDPDITPEEAARVKESDYVLVAILAAAGPKPPLTPYRFVWNLSGGNREAALWTADEIRAKAKDIITYSNEWAPVAD